MGGGGGGDDSSSWLFMQQQEHDRRWVEVENKIAQESIFAAQATQQQLAGTQLDWLRQYGQSTAMASAGIPAPFSTKGGGFGTPILGIAGNLLPLKATGGQQTVQRVA